MLQSHTQDITQGLALYLNSTILELPGTITNATDESDS